MSVRAAHCIYNILCKCLPNDWTSKPPLIWHWTGRDMMDYLKEPPFDFADGFPSDQVMAVVEWTDDSTEEDATARAIHAQIWLATKPYAMMVMYFLHELAHCNGIMDEQEADAEAFRLYKLIARRKAWKETGIRLRVMRTKAHPDDRVYAEPARPPSDTLSWEIERY